MGESFSLEVSSVLGPLREFKGTLQSIESDVRVFTQADGSERQATNVLFNFVEVEVIAAVEPYPFPIAQITISHSPRAETRWAVFAASVKRLLPGDVNTDTLVGKRQHWAVGPGMTRQRDLETDKWGLAETECWQVAAVEGAESQGDILDYVAALADGKTEPLFFEALLTDPKVRALPDLVTKITERKLLPELLEGLLTRDAEGVLHKV